MMDKNKAEQVVEQLVAWDVPASLVPLGLHTAAVRVRMSGGREAVWDADGAAGLEAHVLRDGVLVGFVPKLPGSEALAAGHSAWLIATADDDLSAARQHDADPPPRLAVAGPAPRPGAAAC